MDEKVKESKIGFGVEVYRFVKMFQGKHGNHDVSLSGIV